VNLVYGLIAGATAGLAGSATLACLLPALDFLPRLLGPLVATDTPRLAWLWAPLWIILAVSSWAIWGALAGFVLSRIGQVGNRVLSRLVPVLSALFRLCGLRRASAYFVTAK
jgi:hypothetical protein